MAVILITIKDVISKSDFKMYEHVGIIFVEVWPGIDSFVKSKCWLILNKI